MPFNFALKRAEQKGELHIVARCDLIADEFRSRMFLFIAGVISFL